MILLQHGETLTGGDDDITFGGVQLTGQDLQKGGFTGTVGSDESVTVALGKLDVDIFE